VLVIRETLDDAGQLRECVLERRRGGMDGPFVGDPARVEFTGPARLVRHYRAQRGGRLQEVAATPAETDEPGPTPALSGETDALRAWFGPGIELLDLRGPSLFEDMVGLSAIAHLRLPDGREIAAGVGWFGPLPFVLQAAFARFDVRLELTPADDAAAQLVLRENRLVRHEVRIDHDGLCLMARRLAGLELFQVRLEDGRARLVPYASQPEAAAGDDQARWLRYAERTEGLTILDAWRAGAEDDLLVLAGDAKGDVWRYAIDADGVEVCRRPDDGAAAAVLHRERLFPGSVLESEIPASRSGAPTLLSIAAEVLPSDTLLARLRAYQAVSAAFDGVRDAIGRDDPAATDAAVRMLSQGLRRIGAPVAASAAAALAPHPAGSWSERLADIEARMVAELALVRLAPVATLAWVPLEEDAPFGAAIAERLPLASYDIEEAVRCLALHRPTAAMLHATRALLCGLDMMVPSESIGDWSGALAALRRNERQFPGAAAAFETVRRRWRSPRLAAAAKYTEEEAGQALQALAVLLQAIALGCQPIGSAA
jgi:hypothetical protein